MVDWLTLTLTIIIAISLLIANIYLLAYYCHPDDKGTCIGIVCKVVVVLGLTLAWGQVLMLPLDVSNNRSFGGGINMQLFWYIVFLASIVYMFILYPIITGIYESDPDWSFCDKFKHTFCCFLCTLVVVLAIALILFFTIGKAQVPVDRIYCSIVNTQASSSSTLSKNNCSVKKNVKIEIDISFIIYLIAVMSFISWFIFAVFGGIGLAAIPLDFFYDFRTRPKHLKRIEIDQRRTDLLKNIEDLKQLGNEVKDMENRGDNKRFMLSKARRTYNKKNHEFKAGVMLAQDEYFILNIAEEMKKKGNCILICYFLLIPFGILTSIITLLWIAQIICTFCYMKNSRAGYPFLSYMFVFFQDHDVAFLSFIFFSIFCFYLLWALIKGSVKFGVRFFFFGAIHPMKKDETYMNSFLFNVCLILLGSFSITQFCASSFPDYFAFTDIDIIFNCLVKYLKFFTWFYRYHVFVYILLAVFVISLVYLICKPKDQITAESIYYEKKNDEQYQLKDKDATDLEIKQKYK